MSNMSETELTPRDCATIWNHIPEKLRRLPEGAHPPSTFVELADALQHLGSCGPQELAQALGLAEETDWATSLESLRGLVEHRCPVTTITPETRSRLFKASDVPVFENTADYEGFCSSLLFHMIMSARYYAYSYPLRTLSPTKPPSIGTSPHSSVMTGPARIRSS
jgi:hypothetical protein